MFRLSMHRCPTSALQPKDNDRGLLYEKVIVLRVPLTKLMLPPNVDVQQLLNGKDTGDFGSIFGS